MKHKTFFIILIIILLICALLTVFAYLRNGGTVAEISLDGNVLYEIPLTGADEGYEIPIEQDGRQNIILIENGKVSMKYANCPDGLCIKQGKITNSSYPIVCLPNRVVVKIKGDAEIETPDAISQ